RCRGRTHRRGPDRAKIDAQAAPGARRADKASPAPGRRRAPRRLSHHRSVEKAVIARRPNRRAPIWARVTTVILALLVALLPGAARAVEPSAAADAQARSHYELGQRHYNVGDFDRAIDEFKRAYEISPAPGLLFNIAQAYRAKKDREHALYFYTTYLREDPEAPEREYVEARLRELPLTEPPVSEPPP